MKIRIIFLLFFMQSNLVQANGLEVFDRIWETAKTNIYPSSLRDHFTDTARSDLRQSLGKDPSVSLIRKNLSPFLKKLNISHTGLYTNEDEIYYFLKSTFTSSANLKYKLGFFGVQTESTPQCKLLVKEVLDGFPAQEVGIQQGDCLNTLNGQELKSIQQFSLASGKKNLLGWTRAKQHYQDYISITSWNIAEAFMEATQKSVRIIQKNGKKIGYVHLWSGSHPKSSGFLNELMSNEFKKTDGLILDLRGGYGGAWWEHLEPFFEDTSSFFTATRIHPDGSKDVLRSEVKKNPNAYKKPMVVIINEGVRSGKEAMAYQFQKTKRAVLIGTQTSGSFVSGKPFFVNEDLDYVLYLSANGILVDDINFEGNGVKPDIIVNSKDSQFLRAKKEILKEINR